MEMLLRGGEKAGLRTGLVRLSDTGLKEAAWGGVLFCIREGL